jgi:hypothetical protein
MQEEGFFYAFCGIFIHTPKEAARPPKTQNHEAGEQVFPGPLCIPRRGKREGFGGF